MTQIGSAFSACETGAEGGAGAAGGGEFGEAKRRRGATAADPAPWIGGNRSQLWVCLLLGEPPNCTTETQAETQDVGPSLRHVFLF